MERIKNLIIFLLGGALYVCIELLWRGHSHISMFFVGGLCFLLIGLQNPRRSVLRQMLRGTALITGLELLSGLLLNRLLGLHVWDYSHLPLNLCGQICLPFCLLWFPLSGLALLAEDWLRHLLFRAPLPHYRWVLSDSDPSKSG